MKKRTIALAFTFAAATALGATAMAAPMTDVYNEYGAHKGLDEATQNADISADLTEEAITSYVEAGRYIVSSNPVTENEYEGNGTFYETTEFEYGSGLYVIIQDEDSTNKHYTLIKSAQDLNVGDPFVYVEGDIGGRLLDDKYTSTLMEHNYLDGEFSYVSYDLSGGKLAAQEVALDENGVPESSQAEGFTYIYLVAESAADYYQRLANEEAGYETPAQAEDRAYMPVNNTNQSGEAFNNWTNITAEEEDGNFNDRITRIGGTEGESNTRLYSYSGQNVIVAKICVAITESEAQLSWSESNTYDADTDYSVSSGEIELNVGDTLPLFFHTQYTSTWGRDGYAGATVEYEIADEAIISYVGNDKEAENPNTLTALEAGTTTLTATVADSEGKYAGGATVTLTVTVK